MYWNIEFDLYCRNNFKSFNSCNIIGTDIICGNHWVVERYHFIEKFLNEIVTCWFHVSSLGLTRDSKLNLWLKKKRVVLINFQRIKDQHMVFLSQRKTPSDKCKVKNILSYIFSYAFAFHVLKNMGCTNWCSALWTFRSSSSVFYVYNKLK